jgi:hypothetical protein
VNREQRKQGVSMKTQKRAQKVSDAIYLKTVLRVGKYSKKANAFLNPVNHTELAEKFSYSSPMASYTKYRLIRARIMDATSKTIELPIIPLKESSRVNRKTTVNELIAIIEECK